MHQRPKANFDVAWASLSVAERWTLSTIPLIDNARARTSSIEFSIREIAASLFHQKAEISNIESASTAIARPFVAFER